MSHPFLIGPRIQLRAMEETDAEAFLPWVNAPEMRAFLLVRFPRSLKSEREWIAAMTAEKEPPANIAWAIELVSDNRLIGAIGMHRIEWPRRRAMTGIFLFPESMRGKGYGTEAKNLVIDYAFAELGLRSLWTTVFEHNQASIHAIEKQGYRRGGVMRKTILVNGVWRDEIYYDLLREEWEAMRGIEPGEAAGAPPKTKAARTKRGR